PPTATAVPPTATLVPPTATPVPPTATPVPPAPAIKLDTNAPPPQDTSNGCSGTVKLTNTTGGQVSWTLSHPSNTFGFWFYKVDKTSSASASGTIAAGQQSTLRVTHYGNTCTTSSTQSFSVLVNGAAVASFTFTY
ncbi:MAG TPA: hypothetical protein VID73_02795, partial [Ktedonobacterales bacterium]